MQLSEVVRVIAANLGEGDEVPMAALPSAIPYFLVRLTAICVERRELGVLREFLLRGIQTGLSELKELAGFFGIREADAKLEIDQLSDEFFVTCQGIPPKLSLMEKGVRAISVNGLTRVHVREVSCYVNGATRRIDLMPGDLMPRRRLPTGTLTLPAIPARAPRIEELDISSIKAGLALVRDAMPRIIEISRLGQVLRTNLLYLPGHVLFRRGVHAVPLICTNGSTDSDIARHLGSHPALQSIKSAMEHHERQTKRTISQHRPELREIGLAQPSFVRAALTTFVLYCDANATNKQQAEMQFIEAVDSLRSKSHWLETAEAQVLFSRAAQLAQQRLVIVTPPQSASLFDLSTLESIGTAVRRGVKIELHISPTDPRFSRNDAFFKQYSKNIEIVATTNERNWCGFCCDESFAVVGAVKVSTSTMGRFESFFGAFVTNDPRLHELLDSLAIQSPVTVIKKRKRKEIERPI